MEDFELPAENLKPKNLLVHNALRRARILWSCRLSIERIFPDANFMTGIALIVTTFANQHEVKIPKTSVRFSALETLIFWGAIWLGTPGAVFLAVAASLVRFDICRRNKFQWLFSLFSNTCAAFISASAFYLVIHQFSGFSENTVGDAPIGLAVVGDGNTSDGNGALRRVGNFQGDFYLSDKECSPTDILKSAFAQPAIGYILSVLAAVLLHNLFLSFGLSFGFVILPATVIGHLAYRLHLQRLEQKNRRNQRSEPHSLSNGRSSGDGD